MSKLLDVLFDGWGRAALGAGLFAAIFAWWQVDRAQQRNLGAAHARQEINEAAGDLARKGEAARADAERPGALERLRHHSCRDC